MSPEQASGQSRIDGRADIYALGCTLYEMLAGDPPFLASTPRAVLARQSLDPVPRIHTVRQTVPSSVEQAITKALAKVPADRLDRKSTRLNSSHSQISYAVFCLKKKKTPPHTAVSAAFRYALTVSRRTPARCSIRRKGQPRLPKDRTSCCSSSFTTLLMSREAKS